MIHFVDFAVARLSPNSFGLCACLTAKFTSWPDNVAALSGFLIFSLCHRHRHFFFNDDI